MTDELTRAVSQVLCPECALIITVGRYGFQAAIVGPADEEIGISEEKPTVTEAIYSAIANAKPALSPNHHLRVGERVRICDRLQRWSGDEGEIVAQVGQDDYSVAWQDQTLLLPGSTLRPLRDDLYANRKWSSSYISDLPDSAFLWIDPITGDRKLPYKDKTGKVDYAHLKNALARLAVTDMPEQARARIRKKAEAIFDREFP